MRMACEDLSRTLGMVCHQKFLFSSPLAGFHSCYTALIVSDTHTVECGGQIDNFVRLQLIDSSFRRSPLEALI